ncbi:MAG: BBP7 family outer membrane beta-barrel protein [Gemmataceae bacterium]
MKHVLVTLVTLTVATVVTHAQAPDSIFTTPVLPTPVQKQQGELEYEPFPLESPPTGTNAKKAIQTSPKENCKNCKKIPKSTPEPGSHNYSQAPKGIEDVLISSPQIHSPKSKWQCVGDKCSQVVEGYFPAIPKRVSCMPRFYGEAEYLLWWIRHQYLPPLVTGTNLTPGQIGTTPFPGRVNSPGTQLLLGGGEDLESSFFHGVRGTFGYGLPRWGLGIEATGFYIPEQRHIFSVNSPGNPGLFRPFLAGPASDPRALPIATPSNIPGINLGPAAGSIDVVNSTELYGGEANIRKNLLCSCNHSLDVIGGFRYLNLEENLHIVSTSAFLNTGMSVTSEDTFSTRNEFYGGNLGMRYTLRKGRWVLTFDGKVGFGVMNQTVLLNGLTTTTNNGQTNTVSGGLLTSGANLGRVDDDEFIVMPEGSIRLGYQLTRRLSGYVGYNFLYISSVVRPSEQASLPVDIPGPPDNFPVRDTDFWAQGLTFGLQFRY